jgi:hypothetical protein
MASPASDPAPDPERARRTTRRLAWACAILTTLIGVFLIADVVRSSDRYGALAWLGVALAGLSIAALIAVYVACARGRTTLGHRLVGRFTVFQLSTVPLVVAVGADILIPARNTGALALLLPWGLTYWLHNLTPPDESGR